MDASDAQWRSLVDHTPGLIMILDREHRIEFINRADRSPGLPQILGEPAERFVSTEDRERMSEAIESVFRTGNQDSYEASALGLDGKTVYFNTRVGPVFRNGKVDRVTILATDITEQRNLEEQLRQSQKLEALGQLTGGVAHDFNNLLTVILGNLELLNEELGSNDQAREMTNNAAEAADRAAALTQRLLAFSRKQALRPETIDMRQLVNGMDDLLRRSLGETIEIEIVSAGGQWKCIADRAQLENAILNVALNSRDAMPSGGKLTFETGNVRLDEDYTSRHIEVTPGQYAMISVTDTGTGMSTEVMKNAFDPFFTTKQTGQGTGLGLSMVYGFVLQSGGHVKIYSEVGEGTAVKIYLPRAHATDSDAPLPELSDVEPLGNGEAILVVEDDASVRALTKRLLTQLGYRVLEAEKAAAALVVYENSPRIDGLLTDVVLPGGTSGVALARELQRRRPELPVLFVSGYSENAIIHHGRLDPDVELLEKPFRKAELAKKVHGLIRAGRR